MNGMLTKLSGESVFTLMSLLGANIMPHNFYVHSAIVQVGDFVLARWQADGQSAEETRIVGSFGP